MMPESEVRAIVGRYQMRGSSGARPNGDPVFLAWYAEVPNCIAEAPDREAALRELDSVILPYLMSIAADGAPIPVPLAERAGAIALVRMRLGQLVLGDARSFLGKKSLSTATTDSSRRTPIVSASEELVRV